MHMLMYILIHTTILIFIHHIAFGEIIQTKSRHGVYDASKKIISWSSAALDIRKSSTLTLEVEVHVPVSLPKTPSNVPVIVKGFYR